MNILVDNETEAADFLQRLDIDVDDLESKSVFTSKLIDIFARGGHATPTFRQIDTLFDIGEKTFLDFPSVGIRRIEFERLGKPQTRFVIPNIRGLFGFDRALDALRRLG